MIPSEHGLVRMYSLLVDDIDKARLNRERVSKGYGNKGYNLSARAQYARAGYGNRKLGTRVIPLHHIGVAGALPRNWKWGRQRDEDFSDMGGWQTEE